MPERRKAGFWLGVRYACLVVEMALFIAGAAYAAYLRASHWEMSRLALWWNFPRTMLACTAAALVGLGLAMVTVSRRP